MYKREWTNHETSLAKQLYEAGMNMDDIAAHFPDRTLYSVSRHITHKGWERPDWYVIPRPNRTWDAIFEVMSHAGKPLDCYEIAILSGAHTSVVYKRLKQRHGKLVHVADWRETERKPAALWALGGGIDAPKPVKGERVREDANPFAAAAGLVEIPQGQTGRVYRQSMSIRDDEREAA